MILLLSASLLMILMTPPMSHQSPVALSQENIQILKDDNADNEPEDKMVVDGVHESIRKERSEPDDGSEDDGEEGKGEQLSADTSETMKKINPLTIANQVSQMFRKSDSKTHLSEGKTPDKDSKCCVRGTVAENDPSFALSPDPEDGSYGEGGSMPQEGVKSGSKEPANNFGYSVIVIAGDPVGGPLKLNGKDVKQANKPDGGSLLNNGMKRRENAADDHLKKEIRIPKQFSFCPEFPIYDEDISFIPDPLQGLLDQSYWNKNSQQM